MEEQRQHGLSLGPGGRGSIGLLADVDDVDDGGDTRLPYGVRNHSLLHVFCAMNLHYLYTAAYCIDTGSWLGHPL